MSNTAPVMSVNIADAVDSLGLAGGCICTHSSLSSFGHVVGGPQAVIDGFLMAGCTLLVPTFSLSFDARPPAGRALARNGYPRSDTLPDPAEGYSPESNVVLRNMGAIPAAVPMG